MPDGNSLLLEKGGYVVRLSVVGSNVEPLIALRSRIFRDGQTSDKDHWDDAANHLSFSDTHDHLVGTARYWVHDGWLAASQGYTGGYFDLSGQSGDVRILELGRLAFLPEQRDLDLLRVAASALVDLIDRERPERVIGCYSVHGTDPTRYAGMLRRVFARNQLAESPPAKAGQKAIRIDELPEHGEGKMDIPALLSFYLGLGARIGRDVVIDHDLSTSVLFISLDPKDIPQFLRRNA